MIDIRTRAVTQRKQFFLVKRKNSIKLDGGQNR